MLMQSTSMSAVDWSELIRNYATVIALMVSSFWAASKVAWSEFLRSKQDMPALDSSGIVVQDHELEAGAGFLVAVGMKWRNQSSMPTYIDPKLTRTEVYRVPENLEPGSLHLKPGLGDPLFVVRPLERLSSYVLEPKTESFLQSHMVLRDAGLYVFRVKIARSEKHHGAKGFEWGREIIARVPSPKRAPVAAEDSPTEESSIQD